jgi:hypothetical protein
MDKTVTYSFNYQDLDIDPGKMEYLMGYSQAGSCPEPVVEMIIDVLMRAPKLVDIKGGLLICDPITADRKNRVLITKEQIFQTGKIVTNHLKYSEKAAWFICTVGEKLPDYSRILMEQGDIMEGYVVDVAGNLIVEKAMDKMQEILSKEMAKEGLLTTNRYSPGYCEWEITEQQKLFSLFPKNYLGVKLTESSLMQPIKTVSGVIGIGKKVKNNPYTCNYCSQQNCLYRDKKESKKST